MSALLDILDELESAEPVTNAALHGLNFDDLEQTPVPTAPEPDAEAQAVQDRLRAGEPVLMKMGDIGVAYWVATETQRDELVATLTATGDNTPVYCWGELVRISNWSRDDKLFTYQAKKSFQATIGEPHNE